MLNAERHKNNITFYITICHYTVCVFVFFTVLHRNKLTHTDLKPENILFVCCDCELEFNNKTVKAAVKMRLNEPSILY